MLASRPELIQDQPWVVLTPNIVEFWRLYEAVGMAVPGDSKATAGAVAQLANKCELTAASSQRETQTNVVHGCVVGSGVHGRLGVTVFLKGAVDMFAYGDAGVCCARV